jgi:hypothetical protein
MGRYRGKTLITRYQAFVGPMTSLPPNCQLSFGKGRCPVRKDLLVFPYIRTVIPQTISITHIQSLVSVWQVNFILFNSMLKYVINKLMYDFFHIRTVIIPRPISTLRLKPSGRYRFLGIITVLIWKRACINL